jgi:chromosome segregation ATPase
MTELLHKTFVSTSSLGTSSEVPSAAVMEEIIYGCSSTNTRKKLLEIKTKMLDYFKNIQEQCDNVRKGMTISDIVNIPEVFRQWISDYEMLLNSVDKAASDGICRVETVCSSMLNKITNRLSENDTEWILFEFNQLMSWYDDIRKDIAEKCQQLHDMDKDGEILLQKYQSEKSILTSVHESIIEYVNMRLAKMDEKLAGMSNDLNEIRNDFAEIRQSFAKMNAELDEMKRQQEIDDAEWAEHEKEWIEFKLQKEIDDAEWADVDAAIANSTEPLPDYDDWSDYD